MSAVSRDDIRHLSHLARLELTEEEYDRYAAQLTSVVEYVEQLQQVPTDEAGVQRGVTGMENVLVEDMKRAPIDPCAVPADELLKAAPLRQGNLLEVRAVLDAGEAS